MYHVLICDDEEVVRSGLKTIIDWQVLGWEICGEAANGITALELIRTLNPDLVLLDIKMPGLSGIDILRATASDANRPRFLILTGYADFEFARDAVNLGAVGFMVKPIDEEELAERVKDITVLIAKEKEIFQQLAVVTQLAQKDLYSQILSGNLEPERYDQYRSDPSFDRDFQVALISAELCGYGDRLRFLEKTLQDYFSFLKHETLAQDNTVVMIFLDEREEVILRYMEQFHRRLNYHEKRKDSGLHIGAFASLGEGHHGLAGLETSYKEAKALYSRLFFEMDIPCLTLKKAPPLTGNFNSLAFSASELLSFVEIYDTPKIDKFFVRLRDALYTSLLHQMDVKKFCITFLMELRSLVFTRHPEKELSFNPASDVINVIIGSRYLDEVLDALHAYVNGLADILVSEVPANNILKIIQYVRNNYNKDLKLETLGQIFNCNSAYLGKRFKEQTGESFNSYLDRLRIEAAKKLLKTTDLKIYQISEMVGYSSVDYFFTKFRKYEHMTPRMYRAKY
ncbi:MAG TPA: response regulator [Termitinemataceae bacterium]|nr:response regulator [Termitinemataceae bacterium]HOM23633.1 response regulator [Termitinemataceae bacterium]HPP99733.1 response regulator [Termitinemataceae bacterium]